MGGQQSNYWPFQSNNFSSSQISWTGLVPSSNTYVTRLVPINITGTITFTGVSAGAGLTLLQARGLPTAAGVSGGTQNYDAPRCSPLSQAFTTFNCKINGYTVSQNLSNYSRIFQRFHRNCYEENLDLSMSPMMSDNSLNYSDMSGFAWDPLGVVGNNPLQYPRGSFPSVTITRNDSTGVADTATVDFSFTEFIYLSPFSFSRMSQEQVAFAGITQLDIQAFLGGRGLSPTSGLAASLWSHSTAVGAGTINAASVAITGGTLYLQYIYPQDYQSIPPNLLYSFSDPVFYPQTQPSVAAGQTIQLSSQAIELQSTPQRMYIWVDQRDQDYSMTTTDTTKFSLENLTIRWDSNTTVLSTASKYDLYNIYLRTGGNLSWDAWAGRGSPISPAQYTSPFSGQGVTGFYFCVEFGLDIPLAPTDAPGCLNKHIIQIFPTVKNLSNGAIIPNVNCLVIYEGIFQFDGLRVNTSTALLVPEEIKSVQGQVPVPFVEPVSVLGGSFFSDALGFIKRLVRPAITAAQSLAPAQYQPLVTAADSVAKSYGLGHMGRVKGYGGALMSENQLKMLK